MSNPNDNIRPLQADDMRFTEDFLRKHNTLAFDIGANEGGMIDWLSKSLGCPKVVAFEPVPNMFAKAAERWNGVKGVKLVNAGMSDQPGELEVNVFNAWTLLPKEKQATADQAIEYKGTPDFKIELTTLDAAAEKYGVPSLIKLDVDGYEEKVIFGGMKTLTAAHPPLLMELSYLGKLVGAADYTMPLKLLYGLGYIALSVDGCYRCPTIERALVHFPHFTSYDVLMVHKSDL